MPEFIHDILQHTARERGWGTALRFGELQITYAELAVLSSQLASALRCYCPDGHHVGLHASNSIEYVVGYFAILQAGGVVVPTPASLPGSRLVEEWSRGGTNMIVTTASRRDEVTDAARRAGIRTLTVVTDLGRDFEILDIRSSAHSASDSTTCLQSTSSRPTVDQPALLLATSGTGDGSKRVVLSHRNVVGNARSFLQIADLSPRDRTLIVLPLTACGTNTTELLAYTLIGAETTIYDRPAFLLSEFARLIERHDITVVNLTPYILHQMLESADRLASRLRSLQRVFFASAPMPAELFRRIRQAFPWIEFYYGYGLSEASPRCCMLRHELADAKPGSSGQPLPGVELRIVDHLGRMLPALQQGEITVRGPNVMLGYFQRPELNRRTVQDGWLHTGDLGYLDQDGFLFVTGRKKNLIITRGINVCPEEIEQELVAHPDVADALVLGVPDSALGEAIVARIVPRNGSAVDRGTLTSFLRQRLPAAKIPRDFQMVDRLNRNLHFKLTRHQPPSLAVNERGTEG
jgi:long-chain acyl-CoA synthetase